MIGCTIDVAKLLSRLLVNGELKLPFGVVTFPQTPGFHVGESKDGWVALMFDEGCEPELCIDGPAFLDLRATIDGLSISRNGSWVGIQINGLPDIKVDLKW